MTPKGLLLCALALGAVAGSAVGGYLLGESEAPTRAEADDERQTAYEVAARQARQSSRVRAQKEGREAGLDKGQHQGELVGTQEGEEAAQAEVNQRQAAEAAEAPVPVESGTGLIEHCLGVDPCTPEEQQERLETEAYCGAPGTPEC
jgi:hypothetical protein